MSVYTTDIRTICENMCLASGKTQMWLLTASIDEIIDTAMPLMFVEDIPFYNDDDDAKKEFLHKFLEYYYMREIGAETYALFKLFLIRKLRIRMPYYKELYNTMVLDLPWWDSTNYKVVRQYNKQKSGTKSKDYEEDGTRSGTTDSTSNKEYNKESSANGTINTTSNKGYSEETSDSGNIDTTKKDEINGETIGSSTGHSESENTGSSSASSNKDTETSTTTNTNDTTNNNTRQRFSDTPQMELSQVDNGTYLTTYQYNTDSREQNVTTNTNANGHEESTDSQSTSANTSNDETNNSTVNESETRDYTENKKSTASGEKSGEENSTANQVSDNTDKVSGSETTTMAQNNTNTDKINGNEASTEAEEEEEKETTEFIGKNGGQSYMKMVEEYRSIIVNIDEVIIEECSDLFMIIF